MTDPTVHELLTALLAASPRRWQRCKRRRQPVT